MKLRTLLFTGIAGAVAGYAITKKKTEWITPEKALKLLKEKASGQFSITGAWILVKREDTNIYDLPYTVYKGGFSHSVHGEPAVHYEFLIDAKTGTLVMLTQK